MSNNKPRLFVKGQWVQKREDPFALDSAPPKNFNSKMSRKEESRYGVVISSTEDNKTKTKLRILFYPHGKIDEVAKSRMDYAIAPTDISGASPKFLEYYDEQIRTA